MNRLFDNYIVTEINWTVSDLTAYIRELFDIDYRLQDVTVSGEISNFSSARSGHLYFTLKDEDAQLKCVMWKNAAQKLLFRPSDGDAVVARGRVSVYEASGVYQLYVDRLQPEGRGDLAIAFEKLKERLESEGLFDKEHKQLLPDFPQKIGIVTSADAAALRDILNVLRRRWPLSSVLIAPTLVQGKDAPNQIVESVKFLDGRNDIDLIIVTRGGGSIEDLWAFNDESVARAIFSASHPVIVGVGHETDFTISDFVADVRAPTPSAAAELAVPDVAEITSAIGGLIGAVDGSIRSLLRFKKVSIEVLSQSLRHLSPKTELDQLRQKNDWLVSRLDRSMEIYLERLGSRCKAATDRLLTVDPTATLARGYAIVWDKDNRIIQSKESVQTGDPLLVRVHDGEFGATVNKRIAEEEPRS
jgi:exodeoxyribonuclease VII large subunit